MEMATGNFSVPWKHLERTGFMGLWGKAEQRTVRRLPGCSPSIPRAWSSCRSHRGLWLGAAACRYEPLSLAQEHQHVQHAHILHTPVVSNL